MSLVCLALITAPKGKLSSRQRRRNMAEIRKEEITEAVQSPRDCVLTQFLGESIATFPRDKLTVVKQFPRAAVPYRPEEPVIEVSGMIIGESHCVELFIDGQSVFVELLACVDPKTWGCEPTIYHKFDDGQTVYQHEHFEGRRFQINTSVAIFPPTDFREWFVPPAEFRRSTVAFFMCEEFPGALAPKTITFVQANKEALQIVTQHEYATREGEVALIVTRTRVCFNLG